MPSRPEDNFHEGNERCCAVMATCGRTQEAAPANVTRAPIVAQQYRKWQNLVRPKVEVQPIDRFSPFPRRIQMSLVETKDSVQLQMLEKDDLSF